MLRELLTISQISLLPFSILFAWAITMLLSRLYIVLSKKYKLFQPINEDVPETHASKVETPTAGGLAFVFGTTITVLLFGDISNPYIWLPLAAMWLFLCIGLIDDAAKMRKRTSIGLSSLRKLALQIIGSSLIVYLIATYSGLDTTAIQLPWNSSANIDIGLWYRLFALLFIVLLVNSVNITDGLDGLAAGVSLPVLVLVIGICVLFGSGFYTRALPIPVKINSLSFALVVAACFGSLVAFLWYNSPRALLFMGDAGSHAIGAIIAVSALMLKIEIVVGIASAMLLAECVSSFIQIGSIRIFHKKVFLLAPMHHHFEKRGMGEPTITARMTLISVICAVGATLLMLE